MLNDTADTQLKHEKFIKTICETGVVYGLENEEGFATSFSNEYEDEDGEPIEMICFWSEKEFAEACAKDDWKGFAVAEVPLTEFIEDWCVGMHNDELLAGTDFDSELLGAETEPLLILQQIVTELKKSGKEIALTQYESIDELKAIINENLEG